MHQPSPPLLIQSNAARVNGHGKYAIVVDFWSAKPQTTKYLGIRLYMVDDEFEFKSVSLSTRHFDPKYGDRDRGLRFPFQRWIEDVLGDFNLKKSDLFGSTSDNKSNMKWMMSTGLNLQWEWRLAQLTNAATKAPCGLVDDANRSKNPEMTVRVRHIVKTIYQTKHVEVMGSLFEELCSTMHDGKATQLLDYRSHRILGISAASWICGLSWKPGTWNGL
jgi:hypothetical protein